MQISSDNAGIFLILITLVFLLAPFALIVYIRQYNYRKKMDNSEKEKMKKDFKEEITRTRMEVKAHTMQTIGADLHDNIGQLLGLTNLTLNSIKVEEQDKTAQKVADTIAITKRCIKELRQVVQLVRDDQLFASNLAEAFKAELSWLEKTEKYRIISQINETPPVRDADKDIVLFRLFQEILNNTVKHAECSEINFSLFYLPNKIEMKISDNGVGFDHDEAIKKQGLGIKNIYKRVAMIGGTVLITTSKNKGTSIFITVPYA
jgi:signal transduction histidine kinase